MDDKIISYIQGSLSPKEQQSLLEESKNNEQLRQALINQIECETKIKSDNNHLALRRSFTYRDGLYVVLITCSKTNYTFTSHANNQCSLCTTLSNDPP